MTVYLRTNNARNPIYSVGDGAGSGVTIELREDDNMTGRERFDTFDVTFVFDTTRISTTVMALSPEAAMDMAAEYVARDVNIWPSVLDAAEDVTVMVVDRAVL